MNAAAISGVLHRLGFRPIPTHTYEREGLRVTKSGTRVRVTADLDSARAAAELAEDARQALIEAGYCVEPTVAYNPAAFYVTGKVAS